MVKTKRAGAERSIGNGEDLPQTTTTKSTEDPNSPNADLIATTTPKSSATLSSLSAAAYQVFYTTELLKQILSCQTADDLMEMRLVCHKWDDVILGDPNMKRLMFFKAGSGGIHDQRQDNVTEVWCLGSSKDRVKSAAPVLWNPLLFGNANESRVP